MKAKEREERKKKEAEERKKRIERGLETESDAGEGETSTTENTISCTQINDTALVLTIHA